MYWQVIFLVFFPIISSAFAQGTKDSLVPVVSDADLTILFSVAVAVVIGLVIYLLRDTILRKKTAYDTKDFSSKKDHDYEKYHSDWTSDETDFERPKDVRHREFKKALQESTLPDCYVVLGVQRDATLDEIKRQYRRFVKELHPDKSKDPSTKERLSEIIRAYEILSDIELRQSYDTYFDGL